jgi:serine/threonine protein kinase
MRCIGCDTELQNLEEEFCPSCLAALSSPTASGGASGEGLAPLTPRGTVTPRLQSGTLIADRYRIVRHLGSGGMGIVYQADDLKLRVSVALKFPNPANPTQRDLELFLNEVRLARQITHPNVCRIFDVGEVGGRHFLSMEHVEGEDLASLLRRFGRLPKDRAITIALEICRGLEAAHERGILHRDLKPSNLMIDARGQAKIMDFGLANFSRAAEHYGKIAGTPDYMAPEQRRGESTVRTELYALGLILYELFTGRRARHDFTAGDHDTDRSILAMNLDDVDPIVERVIQHCLEPDPRLRPSSVSAVSALLAKLTLPPWRPSEGVGIPHRKHWVLQRKLGTGGFGETWLAEHRQTRDRRVFKFCSDPGKLKAFQREITLFRFMRETLGGRDDIAALVDWQLDEPPYFIESEFAASVNLGEWIKDAGGAQAVSLDDRVEIVRRVAVALSAAHSVGILHKDVKPANVLVGRDSKGALRVRLCDFGVSVLTDEARLRAAGVTAAGLTDADGAPSPDAGTRLYMAPELIEGKPPTTSADTYALGVMLYQLVIGDLTRALAPGWDRDIGNDLLREDIAAAVDGAPERRLSAAQLAERLQSLPERADAREADLKSRERARLAEVAVRRRRNWATAVLAGLLFLSLGLGFAFERAESSARQALIGQTLRSNEAMVRLAAAAVSDKLEDAIRRVTDEASDVSLRNLLERAAEGERLRSPLRDALQRHLDQVHIRQQPRFQSWGVSDKDAWVWARSPYDPVAVGQNYKYRDWFNGRVELPRDAKIPATPRTSTGFSLAFMSTAMARPLLIGLASPVFAAGANDSDKRIVGVLNAGIHLETFNGWLQVAERRPGDGGCPERFVLLLHRTQLIRHPCPGPGAPPLPVDAFSDHPAVAALLKSPNRSTSGFRDPLRWSDAASAHPALAVASTLDKLPDWTLLLEQDVHVALQPMTSLTTDFHGPAHLAFGLGIAAFLALAVLVWWGARARLRERLTPG